MLLNLTSQGPFPAGSLESDALLWRQNELSYMETTFAAWPRGLRTTAGIFCSFCLWKRPRTCIAWCSIVLSSVTSHGESLQNLGDTRVLQQWGEFTEGTTWGDWDTLQLAIFTFRRAQFLLTLRADPWRLFGCPIANKSEGCSLKGGPAWNTASQAQGGECVS